MANLSFLEEGEEPRARNGRTEHGIETSRGFDAVEGLSVMELSVFGLERQQPSKAAPADQGGRRGKEREACRPSGFRLV